MQPEDKLQFKKQLQTLAEEIATSLSLKDPSSESITPDKAIGRLTRMEAIQAQSVSEDGRRRLRTRLKNVERALEVIEKGNYGLCMTCGSEIPRGRLEIMPESHLCISCASGSR